MILSPEEGLNPAMADLPKSMLVGSKHIMSFALQAPLKRGRDAVQGSIGIITITRTHFTVFSFTGECMILIFLRV